MEKSCNRVKLCRSKTAGHIKVHQSDYFKELTRSTEFVKKEISKDDSSLIIHPSTTHSDLKLRRSHSSNLLSGWLSEKSIRNVQEKTDYESKEMANMYYSLLESEGELQKDLDKILLNDQIIKNRKLHWLLQKWYEKTYIPLDNKLCNEMNNIKWKDFDCEKRKQFINYLKHRNMKGHVFLDIYEEAEYDPMFLNKQKPGPIKAATEKLADPLIHQQTKRNEEDRIVHACDLGVQLTEKQVEEKRLPKKPLVPLGRHDTECSTWLDMKLYDIQSHVRLRSQERLYGVRNVSTVCLHNASDEKNESEMFTGQDKWRKKRQFAGNHATLKLI